MKKKLYWLITIVFILLAFIYGLYLGTINNNYIHTQKTIFKNTKFLASNYFKSFFTEIPKVDIKLSEKQLSELQEQQQKYINKRVLIKDSIKWFNIHINTNNDSFKGKVKLKGLLLDKHERYKKKFSYSIKIINGTFKNLSSFYLHYPEKRHNLFEWYGDKLLEHLDLINHKNEFVNLHINGVNSGLYLLEEHTNRKLLTKNKRPIGPIVYFSKDGIKEERYFEKSRQHSKAYIENFYNADIQFKYKHEKNQIACNLLIDYLNGKTAPETAFNFEKTASLFATAELAGYVHHLQYHNIKFYYNPEIKKLEPIANDFEFSQLGNWTNELFVLDKMKNQNDHVSLFWSKNLLNDKKFIDLVIKKLKKIATNKFIDSFLKQIKEEESLACIAMSNFDPIYVSDMRFILMKNMKHIKYILNSNKNVQSSIFQNSKFFCLSKSVIPLKPLSISNADDIYFAFSDSLYLKTKRFLNPPIKDSIKIKMQKTPSKHSTLFFNYKFLGDTAIYSQEIKIKK